MVLVGLTGGIATGKSTVAKRFVELGATHIDADRLARDVVEPGTPGLANLVSEFGTEILSADGSLDREHLGSVVFGHPEALARLNSIVHPAVRERAGQLIARVAAASRGSSPANVKQAVVVYEVPLLVEAAVDHKFDLIVVTSAARSVQIDRLVQYRGLTREQAESRIAAQTTDEARKKIADFVIKTDGTLADTISQVDDVWRHILWPKS